MTALQSEMNVLTDDDAKEEQRLAKQRKRSIAIALTLAALMVMFYVTAWLRFGGMVSGN